MVLLVAREGAVGTSVLPLLLPEPVVLVILLMLALTQLKVIMGQMVVLQLLEHNGGEVVVVVRVVLLLLSLLLTAGPQLQQQFLGLPLILPVGVVVELHSSQLLDSQLVWEVIQVTQIKTEAVETEEFTGLVIHPQAM
jgi:hypothetical protein